MRVNARLVRAPAAIATIPRNVTHQSLTTITACGMANRSIGLWLITDSAIPQARYTHVSRQKA
jgi:hypothetical protein